MDEHLVAFRRHDAVTVATRLPHGLEQRGGWGDTVLALAEGGWQDELTGTRHQGPDLLVREVLADFPVALLVRRS
jgi:(1->4)-alpha-D-glucan 1-alpha-D-glucosylmutase